MNPQEENQINLVQRLEAKITKENIPQIETGDTVKIKKVVQEGTRERIQVSEGVVIAQKNFSVNRTITVRKTVQNIGVERVYLIHSPQIKSIEILRKAKVRRSKLYYLRERSGKATRLKQKFR